LIDLQGGFSRWDIAFFDKFWVAGVEFVVERPGSMKWRRATRSQSLLTMAGTNIHQGTYLGGDAPVNLAPMEVQCKFSIADKDEAFRLGELLSMGAIAPQDFFPGIWISDVWYIPVRGAGQTTWRTSRQLPYDIVDILHLGDYTPECMIDGVAQTLVTTGTPDAGEFKVEAGVESESIVLPSGISGSYLTLRYPPKMMLTKVELDDDISEENAWEVNMKAEEFLPSRAYAFTVP
jgi:hypothetical protein